MLKGMPVKIDTNSYSVSIVTEDNSDSLSDDMLTYPTDDIWKKFDDFLETPPQSPPIKFDLVSDLVELSALDQFGSDPYLHNADVLHDCMWSGQCIEDNTNSNNSRNQLSMRKCGKSVVRPDTPFNPILSTSSLGLYTTFNDLLMNCGDSSNDDMDDSQSSMDDEDFNSSQDSSQSSQTNASSYSKVKESLINDHSYDGSCVSLSHSYRNRETQSLIYPASHKRKMKCHKINTKKMKIIKATQITNTTKQKQQQQSQQSIAVPTVRIIRNNQHFVVKAKSFIASNNSNGSDKVKSEQPIRRTKCKFSTRRKASTVTTERSAMLAQSHHQFQLNNFQPFKLNNISCDTSDDSNEMKSVDKSNKQVPPLRRREHNDSERKRRDHLRNAFLNLRDQIPKLKSAEKRPPRILILHEATSCVNHLNDKNKYLERTRNAEFEKRERLLKILSNELNNEKK